MPVAPTSRGPRLEAPIWRPGPCPCDHTPWPLAPPSHGCWRSRAPQPSPRLMVPSLGDSCSPNPLGLIINQDEMRVTGCERQTLSGSMTDSRVLSVHIGGSDSATTADTVPTWPRLCGRCGRTADRVLSAP